MTKHKKLLQFILTLVLMSLLVVGTRAAFPDQDKIENKTAVNMNGALGIIRGRDTGYFDPYGMVTRAEMAKMICMVLNGGKEPAFSGNLTPAFSDIKGHWAESYIEYCALKGIVSGMGDGTFRPNDKLTGTQSAKMLLVALGYDAVYEQFNGVHWSLKINVLAYQKKLYDELTIEANHVLTRDKAAQMIWNALNATMVKYTYGLSSVDGVLHGIKFAGEYSDKRTLLSVRFHQADYEGQLSRFSYHANKKAWTYTLVNPAADAATMTFTSKLNYTSLYGQTVTAVYKQDGAEVDSLYGMFATDSTVLFSGVVNDLTIKSDRIQYQGRSYRLDKGTASKSKAHAFTYNTAFQLAKATALNELSQTQMTYSYDAIDQDGDGEVDFLMTYPYTVEKVSYVGVSHITAGASYDRSDCEVFDGIAKNDYTKITAAANTATNTTCLNIVDNVIDGTVKKVTGKDYSIDGAVYALANGLKMTVGDRVQDAAVVNNFIFAAKIFRLDIQDYALVMNAVASSENGVYGNQAKLLFTDGREEVVSTDQSYTQLKGLLVTYSSNRYQEYTLSKVEFSSTDGSCFDKAIASGELTGSSQGKQVQYIDGCNIADDGVIFVKVGDGSPENPLRYEVISGANLLTVSKVGLSLNGAFAVKNTANGFDKVKLAYISTAQPLSSADTQYGYAVSDYALVKNSHNETAYEYTLWNGIENRKILAQPGLNTPIDQGDVLAFTQNLDGEIDRITAYSTRSQPAAEVCAITAFDGSRIQLNGASNSYELKKDATIILFVDNEEGSGIKDASVQRANQDFNGNYIPNALVLCSDSQVDLIVVDVNNDICNVASAQSFAKVGQPSDQSGQ